MSAPKAFGVRRNALQLPLRASTFCRFQARKEILEERLVNAAALGMILHSQPERIIAETNLLDDPIMRGPGFHFQIVA